jgi:hypothetical protein
MDSRHLKTLDDNFRGPNRTILAPKIVDVIEDLRPYHPLTVRQVYYQLVAKEIIENKQAEYKRVSSVLTKLRKLDIVSWSAIIDRSRRLIPKRGVVNVEDHIADNMAYLFDGYSRCLVQNQENYIEVWTEKDALAGIFQDVVRPYCCRVGICRGMPSATYIESYAVRARAAERRGQEPMILYFGDLDPTGLRIPVAIEQSLEKDHGVYVRMERIALWPQQVGEYDLPFNPNATKTADPNYRWYCQQGLGAYSVELDALHPEYLTMLIEDALVEHLDTEDMDCQRDIQTRERQILKELKLKFIDVCHEEGVHVAY